MGALSLGLIACKTGATPDPDTALTDPADAEGPSAASREGLSARDYVAVLGAAGCEAPQADSARCAICPDTEPATAELFPGDFTAPGKRGVVVSTPACAQGGDPPTTRLILVEQDRAGVWTTAGAAEATHLTRCRSATDTTGRAHMLCVAQLERYGTTSTYHTYVGWSEGKPSPSQATLVEVAERESCALNYSVEHTFEGPTFEASADGDPRLVLEVTTTMGPFTRALDACPEEGFEGPLQPSRQVEEMTTSLTYVLTPEGVRERDGKGSYVSLGAEFEELMEQ
jgi:hypothetical protein